VGSKKGCMGVATRIGEILLDDVQYIIGEDAPGSHFIEFFIIER